MILTPKNKLIKKIASLKQKKYRNKLNLFCVEGIRLAEEAFTANWPVKMCLYTKNAPEKERAAAFLNRLSLINAHNQIGSVSLIEISEDAFKKISDTKEPQGIMLIGEKFSHSLNELLPAEKTTGSYRKKMPFIAVLDGISDPGNAGTIIRTAAAAGCTGVVLLKDSVDLFSGKTIRATMGALFHIPIAEEVEHSQLTTFLKKHKISLFAATLDNDAHIYHQANLRKPLAIAFGNESGGLSQDILSSAEDKIHIPINGGAESLNVAIAAAIMLYEAVKQQSQQ